MKNFIFISFLLFYHSSHCKRNTIDSLVSDDESRLRDYLFKYKGYNHLIRPVVNLTNVVHVQLELALIQLINVEEKAQIMKSNVWIRMVWRDYQLTWEPADFGGIKVTRVRASTVWKPDIVLFNNADGNYEVFWQPNILVKYTGEIVWIPPAIYVSSCNIVVRYFPFDEQKCDIRFGSWTFNAKQISLQFVNSSKIDLSTYWKSGTWDIVSCSGHIINGTMDSTGTETPMIIYQLTIRRKTLFYTVILILPCLLISLLTVTVFYLPADDHHKMTLCISILLALIVFFLLISKLLPATSTSIPLISKFLVFTFITNIIVIVLTVIIINLNYRTPRTHYMAPWVKKLFIEYLPVLLGMNRPKHIEQELLDRRKIGSSISPRSKRRTPSTSAAAAVAAATATATGASVPTTSNSQRRSNFAEHPGTSVLETFCNLTPDARRIVTDIDSRVSVSLLKGNNDNRRVITDYVDARNTKWCHDSLMMPSVNYSSHVLENEKFAYARNVSENDSLVDYVSSDSDRLRQSPEVMDDDRYSSSNENSSSDNSKYFRGIEITDGIREAMLSINFISAHTELQDEFNKGKLEWQFMASVIDRLMLLIFSTVSIIGSAVLFLRTPYFFSLFDPNHRENEC